MVAKKHIDSPDDREILSVKISKKSIAGWREFCAHGGVSLTAMIEVAGLQLAKETMPPKVPARLEMIKQAREIDLARRSRKK
jgi:hypothetical protein